MIHQGVDDSPVLVPRPLLGPKQMTFIKRRTASQVSKSETGRKKKKPRGVLG